MVRRKQWCEGWIAGFLAAMFLRSGHYNDYERDRDEYLSRKGWKPSQSPVAGE